MPVFVNQPAQKFKVEVIADASGEWASNQMRFDTEEQAFAYGENLADRWMAVRKWRVVPAAEVANA
jgi:hypothetical protein